MSSGVRVNRPAGLDPVEWRDSSDIRYRFDVDHGVLVILSMPMTVHYAGYPSKVAAYAPDKWMDVKYV